MRGEGGGEAGKAWEERECPNPYSLKRYIVRLSGSKTESSLRTRSPSVLFDSWDPRCVKKIGGPFQSGCFSV